VTSVAPSGIFSTDSGNASTEQHDKHRRAKIKTESLYPAAKKSHSPPSHSPERQSYQKMLQEDKVLPLISLLFNEFLHKISIELPYLPSIIEQLL